MAKSKWETGTYKFENALLFANKPQYHISTEIDCNTT